MGPRRPRLKIPGRNSHRGAELLVDWARHTSFPTRSGVREVQETNRRAETEEEMQPKLGDWGNWQNWSLQEGGVQSQVPPVVQWPSSKPSIPALPPQASSSWINCDGCLIMSPPDGRPSAEGYKFPRLIQWARFSSFFPIHPSQIFSFASWSETQHLWSSSSYIVALTLTQGLLNSIIIIAFILSR